MHDDEKRILDWLLDRNPIQRTSETTLAGKKVVTKKADLSGGQRALIALLHTDRELSRSVREALARALEPDEFGTSVLQLKKRARRTPGRPSADSSVKGAVRKAYDMVRYPETVEKAQAAIKKRRPFPALGMSPKKVTKDEIITEVDVSRSKHYRLSSDAKTLKSRTK
jgi:hypothetical protein